MSELELHQIPLPLSDSDSAKFDNFVVGEGDTNNQMIVDALIALVELQKTAISSIENYQSAIKTPLFLSGDTGSGKTHLLSAFIESCRDKASQNAAYLDLNTLPDSPQILELANAAPIVCIENIDAWSGEEELERALFTLVEEAKRDQRLLLVTAKQSPENCEFKLKDLVSRLKSGIEFKLQTIGDEAKETALKLRAKNRGLIISDEAISFLMNRYARDTGSLFASLKELDRASIISKRKVTIPFIQKVLG